MLSYRISPDLMIAKKLIPACSPFRELASRIMIFMFRCLSGETNSIVFNKEIRKYGKKPLLSFDF